MFLIYSATFIMGASALMAPPTEIEGAVGGTLTLVWAGLLILCGVFGASGVFPGLWWAERVAVRAGFTGAAIFAAVVIHLHASYGPNLIPKACAVIIVALAFLGRGHKIRGINYEPRPERR